MSTAHKYQFGNDIESSFPIANRGKHTDDIFDEKQKQSQDFSGKTVDSVLETVRKDTTTDGTNGERCTSGW